MIVYIAILIKHFMGCSSENPLVKPFMPLPANEQDSTVYCHSNLQGHTHPIQCHKQTNAMNYGCSAMSLEMAERLEHSHIYLASEHCSYI